jgi:hypothetical protein
MSYKELFDKSKKSILIVMVVLAVLMVLLWVIVVVLPSNTEYDWKVTTLSWILGLSGLLMIGCLAYVMYEKDFRGLTLELEQNSNVLEETMGPDGDATSASLTTEETESAMNLAGW